VLVGGHLWQQESLGFIPLHDQAVTARLDLLDIQHAAQRREHRDFVLQLRQFAYGDWREPPVAHRRKSGHIAHSQRQRRRRRYVADAAPQIAVLSQRHKGAALLRQRSGGGRRVFVKLVLADHRLDGLTRHAQQFVPLAGAESDTRSGVGLPRRPSRQRHCAITHHPRAIPGDIPGIRVLQNNGLVCAEALGGDHGRDNRSATASLPDALREIARHGKVVPLLDRRQRFVIHPDGFVIGVVVGEIRAGHDQRLRTDQFSQSQAQCTAGSVLLISHHDWDKLELAQHALQERKLHFHGMLALVRIRRVAAAGELDERAGTGQLLRERLVDGNAAERSVVSCAVVHRGKCEGFVVGGRDHHDPLIVAAFDQGVGPSRHVTGILVAGMWRNDGQQVRDRRRRGLRHEAVDHLSQLLRIGGIERSGDRGGPHGGGLDPALD